jgi:hypothetical protein
MSDLRVPTTRQPVTITCSDGRAFDGHVFLPAQSSRHAGPMRPDEWSDTVPTFFPFRARDAAHSTIFSLDAIVAFTVPIDDASAAAETLEALMADAPVARVTVDACGASFEGDVIIDMPTDRQRVADFLNASGTFLTVRARAAHHLIHKRHITRVVELPESGT